MGALIARLASLLLKPETAFCLFFSMKHRVFQIFYKTFGFRKSKSRMLTAAGFL
jgi:hypothetical protein